MASIPAGDDMRGLNTPKGNRIQTQVLYTFCSKAHSLIPAGDGVKKATQISVPFAISFILDKRQHT
jgi:hypothetical protein